MLLGRVLFRSFLNRSLDISFFDPFIYMKYNGIFHNANSLLGIKNHFNHISKKYITEYKFPHLTHKFIYLSSFYFICLSKQLTCILYSMYNVMYKPAVSGICLNISYIFLSLYLLSMFTFLPLDSLFKFNIALDRLR